MWSSSPSRTGPAMLRGRKSSRRCPAFGRCARARIARRSPWPLCTAPCPRCSGCSSGAAPGDSVIAAALDRSPALAAAVLDSGEARTQLRTGRIALLVVPGDPLVYRYDSTRTESRLARLEADEALQRARGRPDVASVRDERVTEPGSRYIDFLIPGLLGMNLMGSGLWGVGFSVVQARTKKLLKRFMATPMRRSHYLL